MSMEKEKNDRGVSNPCFQVESDSDDDLIQMENITDLDSSTEIIDVVTNSHSEVSLVHAACVRDVHEEEHIASDDDDDDLIKMEYITDLDSSIEVIEPEVSNPCEDETKKSSLAEEQVTSETADCSYEEAVEDNQAGGDRWVVRKCRVLVKKTREMRNRKEVVSRSDLNHEDEEHYDGVDNPMNLNVEKSSILDMSFEDGNAKMSSCSSSSTPTMSLPSSTMEGDCSMMNKEAFGLGKYDCFLEELEQNKSSYRKVKCLLCGDGRIMTYHNFGGHVKALHEPPVKCKICGKEFNVVRLNLHMRKWHREADENNNVDRRDVTEDISAPLPRVTRSAKESTSQPEHPVPAKHVEDIIYLSMTSAKVKGVSLKMGLKKGSKIKAAMKKFGKRYKVPWTQLNFFLGNTELTGGEMADKLDGANIKVCGPK